MFLGLARAAEHWTPLEVAVDDVRLLARWAEKMAVTNELTSGFPKAAAIHLCRRLLPGFSNLPGTGNGADRSSSPIWSCSAWGLPCQPHYCGRGALLPHLFTLTRLGEPRLAVRFLWHYP